MPEVMFAAAKARGFAISEPERVLSIKGYVERHIDQRFPKRRIWRSLKSSTFSLDISPIIIYN